MARIMVLSGVVTIVAGVVCGALVWTPLYAIAAFGLVDFALAWAYSSGRLGTSMNVTVDAERPADGGIAEAVEADPSHNPYARED